MLQVNCIKSRTVLPGLAEDAWTDEHNEKIINFFNDNACRLLVAYIDSVSAFSWYIPENLSLENTEMILINVININKNLMTLSERCL